MPAIAIVESLHKTEIKTSVAQTSWKGQFQRRFPQETVYNQGNKCM